MFKIGDLVAYQGPATYYAGKKGIVVDLFRLSASSNPELNAKANPDSAIIWIGGSSEGRPSARGSEYHPFALKELRKL